MSRYIPEHPKKGSAEAYEWAERMRQARQKKARTKARVREAGQLTEMQFFGPGGSLEVKRRTKKNPSASFRKSGDNFLPVIQHDDGRRETLHGPPLATRGTAKKYALLEIHNRRQAHMNKNPGARYHEEAARVAGRYRKDAAGNTERVMYAGMEIAHKDSANAARKLGMNPKHITTKQIEAMIELGILKGKPKEKTKKNPIAVYNPPAPKVVGTIYNKAIEIRAKKTGSDLAGKYKHVFGKNVKILGLDNGDVVIHHTGGKRLWISRKDYERSGRKHK